MEKLIVSLLSTMQLQYPKITLWAIYLHHLPMLNISPHLFMLLNLVPFLTVKQNPGESPNHQNVMIRA